MLDQSLVMRVKGLALAVCYLKSVVTAENYGIVGIIEHYQGLYSKLF